MKQTQNTKTDGKTSKATLVVRQVGYRLFEIEANMGFLGTKYIAFPEDCNMEVEDVAEYLFQGVNATDLQNSPEEAYRRVDDDN